MDKAMMDALRKDQAKLEAMTGEEQPLLLLSDAIDTGKLAETLAGASKGPWAIELRKHKSGAISARICSLCSFGWDDFARVWVRRREGERQPDEVQATANAALMAMAPDLAAAYLAQSAEMAKLRAELADAVLL